MYEWVMSHEWVMYECVLSRMNDTCICIHIFIWIYHIHRRHMYLWIYYIYYRQTLGVEFQFAESLNKGNTRIVVRCSNYNINVEGLGKLCEGISQVFIPRTEVCLQIVLNRLPIIEYLLDSYDSTRSIRTVRIGKLHIFPKVTLAMLPHTCKTPTWTHGVTIHRYSEHCLH